MNNAQIAALFEEVAQLLEIRGDNIHRVLSYRRAGESIQAASRDLRELASAGELTSLPGIGKTLAEKIEEILTTGQLTFYERLAAEIPPSLTELLRVDGLGPKRVKTIFEQLGVTNLDELESVAKAGKLRELPKMGRKSEEKIVQGIAALRRFGDGRFLLGDALPLAEQLITSLRSLPQVVKTEIAGSLRRRKETIGDVDLLAAVIDDHPDTAAAVMTHFCTHELAVEVALHGPTKSRITLANGLGVDLRVLPLANWGTLLSYFTGSQAHNVRLRELAQKQGLSLNEYSFTRVETGEEILCATEDEVYRQLNLPPISPRLREDRGELEAAARDQLPTPIKGEQIVSDLHMHTTWSDGKMSVMEMALAAKGRGLKYIAITDHSHSLGVANGLSPDRVQKQAAEIAAANAELGPEFRVLHGTEMEIRSDGTLDFSDELLAGLDFVIAALHVSLNQPRTQITDRLLQAIENPHVDMIAHPTGRLLGRRDGGDLDMETIFAAANQTGTILEINASPYRLDLHDRHVRRATELGVLLSINSDAHHVDQLEVIPYGLAVAERGWAPAEQVINTWPIDKLLTYLNRQES